MSEDQENKKKSELSKNLKELGSFREQGKLMSAGINTSKKSHWLLKCRSEIEN